MGAQSPRAPLSPEELAYYHAVEDYFALLRGTQAVVLSKDYVLLRKWWNDGVPLAAVMAGIAEAMERRPEREGEGVFTVRYCRHAILRHAKRLALAGVGGETGAGALDSAAAIARCAAIVREAARRWHETPRLAAALGDLALAVERLPQGAPPGALDMTIAELERGTLLAVAALLPAELKAELATAADAELSGHDLTEEVRERTLAALKLKRIRALLGLPRLELDAGAP
ncbi:MAG: hypothetical protein V1750_11115 [Acidobacteriota bacterium]